MSETESVFTILSEKLVCPVLTQDNVLEEFEKAGIALIFYDETKLADLYMGDFNAPTSLAKLNQNTRVTEISIGLQSVKLSSAGLLSLARKLIENPHCIDNQVLCIQGEKADSQGNFVYAIAHRWFGKRYLYVYRGSSVWHEGNVFLVRLQV